MHRFAISRYRVCLLFCKKFSNELSKWSGLIIPVWLSVGRSLFPYYLEELCLVIRFSFSVAWRRYRFPNYLGKMRNRSMKMSLVVEFEFNRDCWDSPYILRNVYLRYGIRQPGFVKKTVSEVLMPSELLYLVRLFQIARNFSICLRAPLKTQKWEILWSLIKAWSQTA